MTTAFVSLANAIQTALAAAPALAGGRVYLHRLAPVAAAHSTAVVVRLRRSRSLDMTTSARDYVTAIDVELYGRSATGADPAAAVDALLETAWARLKALSPASVGAVRIVLGADIEWDFSDAGEAPVASAVIRLEIHHRTASASLAPA